jgi:hypothetical protein
LPVDDLPVPDGDDRNRLVGFAYHLGGYFVVSAACAAINFLLTPDRTWALIVIIGWSPFVTLHAAFAIGLFDVFKRR